MYLFQCPLEFSYNGANMIGRMTSTLSLMRLQKYSLFQKYKARSATLMSMLLAGLMSDGRRSYLEMWAGHRFGQLVEQRFLHLRKLVRIHYLEDVFHLIQKHDFLGTIDFRPVPKEAQNNLATQVNTRQCSKCG